VSEETTNRYFDELASGSISRRRALRLMGAALVGGLLASMPGIAQAAPNCGCPPEVSKCCGTPENHECCNIGVAVCCRYIDPDTGERKKDCETPDICVNVLNEHIVGRH
jgi:hypothetical protein